jgi:hypothetical protein
VKILTQNEAAAPKNKNSIFPNLSIFWENQEQRMPPMPHSTSLRAGWLAFVQVTKYNVGC